MRTFVLVALALSPSVVSAQTTLVWKFKTGDLFAYEMIHKAEETAIVRGQTLKQDVRATWVYRFEVAKTTQEAAHILVTIEKVSVQHLAGDASTTDKFLENAKGATLALTVSPRGEVASMEGYDKFINRIVEKREGLGKVFRERMTESDMKQGYQEIFVGLPAEPVSAGSHWARVDPPRALSTLGRLLITRNAVHDDLDRAGNHKLVGKLTAKYELPAAPAESFRVTGGSLAMENGQWLCTFDNERGRVLHQRFSSELRGELTVEIAGVMTPVQMTSRRESAYKLLPRE